MICIHRFCSNVNKSVLLFLINLSLLCKIILNNMRQSPNYFDMLAATFVIDWFCDCSDLHTWADTVPYKNCTSPLNTWLDIFLLLSSHQTVFPGKLIVGLWYDMRNFLTTHIFVILWDDELISIVLEALLDETLQ